jgi:hypothetical protein
MEILGFTLDELIFSLFLPFLFFYILLYALLTKSKIFGENANKLNSVLALVISALGIFSLYYLGLTTWLPFLAAFLIVSSFIIIFAFGVGSTALKKVKFYEEEAIGDRKKFEEGIGKCKSIWERFEAERDDAKKMLILGEMKNEVERIKPLAEKLGKNLNEYEWYRRYEEIRSRFGGNL